MKIASPKVNLTIVLFLAFAFPHLVPAALQAEVSSEAIEHAQELSQAFEQVAESVTPAVVNIRAVKKIKTVSKRMRPMPNHPFFDNFRDFFGDDFDQLFPFQPPDGYAQEGMGTGVILDEKGHIVTNNHVIGEADEITVKFHDGREATAKLVGADPKSDLAVIQVNEKKLSPARLGDSEKLRIGEWVVAAGNPFGLDNTITAGIVSAKGRSIMPGKGQYEDFIQTDAAINPGNSGGPLVNLKGEVVGINTAIFSRSGGYMGIGFAIPANMVKSVTRSLIEKGKVVRGWLGIVIQPLTQELAESFNFPGTDGILIGDTDPDGPAAKAGLRQGDIIVKFQGDKIKNINNFRNNVAAIEPGTEVELEIVRDGRKRSVEVKVDELPSKFNETEEPVEEESITSDLGIQVESLTPELAKRLNTRTKQGVVVASVMPGSVAARAGLQTRDVITSVNGRKIEGASDFAEVIGKSDLQKGVRLVIESGGMERFVFLKAN